MGDGNATGGHKFLTEEEIDAKRAELGGDILYLKSSRWEVILKPPALKDWELFLVNRDTPAMKSSAGYILIRSMLAYAAPGKGTPIEVFDGLRRRWVGIVEAISKLDSFDRFIGLEVVEEEKK